MNLLKINGKKSLILLGHYNDQDNEPNQSQNHEPYNDLDFHITPVHHPLKLFGVFLKVSCKCF